ncbi:MAG: hypothetical protein A2008_02790 [Candidatus Wallbacteria bacterium GWC2_49_35]|uniref:Uncharacterized protein n=1 Tax=Candidatus Wallbacteria bacterium GWC2_49_35 TaxID=1817813 RepID=A0A1F7WQB1_9BACT|nr:MAG: hypothetical protein A2008_02790 [Candidatus Wallbacteria bacterium GWC2_49_35]
MENKMQADIICEQKIPLDESSWQAIITGMRLAFFGNRFDEYFKFLSGCYMNDKEIAERKGFYLRLAAMLSRHLRMTPQLYEAYPYIEYIAADLVECVDKDLLKAGGDLGAVCKSAQEALKAKEPKKDSAVVAKPPAPEDRERFIAERSGDLKKLFVEVIDEKWVLDGSFDRTLALACELLYLERPDAEAITSVWFNNEANLEQVMCWFIEDFCLLLRGLEENDWIVILCRLAQSCGFDAPNLHSLQAEACFKLREYQRVIGSVTELEKKYKITPFLEHIKCFSLWQTSQLKECAKILRRRLDENPGDILAALLAGDVFMSRTMLENAVKAYSYAYHLEPGAADILFLLARAYHACYFTDQKDLCVAKAETVNPGIAKKFKFGVELYLKCSQPGVRARIDGIEGGDCPLCLKGIEGGKRVIEWLCEGGGQKRLEADLKDGYIYKFKYLPEENKVESEESRDGRITVYSGGEAVELDDLLKDYAVKNLDDLPKPAIADFLGESAFERI